MWTLQMGVTAGVGVVCLILALLMATLGGNMWPPVQLALLITGVAGAMTTPIGGGIRDAVNSFGNWAGGALGQWTGISVLTVAAFAAAAVVILNVAGEFNVKGIGQGQGIDGRTKLLSASLPLFAGAIPGAAGALIATALGFITQIVAWVITSIVPV